MKAFLTCVMLVLVAAPAMAQVVIRRPIPVPPSYPYPYPPYPTDPWRDPWNRPFPEERCFGERFDRASALTREAAMEKLSRFEIEKAVQCTLTSSSLDRATGNCFEASGERFARLTMSFNVNCIGRNVSSSLRKTTIKYY